jgi:dUTP pyrophosphatase
MQTDTVYLKRYVENLPLPTYHTPGAAAFDLYARTETVCPPKTMTKIPLNIAVKVPANHMTLLVARSSLHKKGLMMGNGIGVVDEDYCGDGDELQALLYNFTEDAVIIPAGERIVQAIIMPVEQYVLAEVKTMDAPDRGGFGTTNT